MPIVEEPAVPDPSFILPLLLQSAIAPFGIALAALLVLHKTRAAAFAPTFAIAAGFIASYFAVFHAQWSFPPQQALDWLPWIVAVAIGGATAVEIGGDGGRRLLARLALSLGTAAAVAWPAMGSSGMQKTLATIAIAGALMAGAWSWLARAAKSRPTPPLLLTVVAGGSALALMLDASLLIGQLTGALAITFAACAAFNISRLRAAFSGAATGVAALLLGALLLNATIYAGFSPGYVLLLGTGLLADPLIEAVNCYRKRTGHTGSWIAVIGLSAIPVLATVGLAIRTAQESGAY